MGTEITIFENAKLGAKIRKIDIDGEPWFVAADIAESLGYSNTSQTIQDHCKHAKSLKALNYIDSIESLHINSLVIPESDLYRLILRSRLPKAEEFQDWVTEEVLPSIRKTGAYISPSITPRHLTDLVRDHIELFGKLGGMDERDEIFYKDILRGQLLLPKTEQGRREWSISDRIMVITGRKPDKRDVIAIGKRMASAYRAEYDRNPPKREQFVDGATRMVYHYSEWDLPMLDRVITEYYSE